MEFKLLTYRKNSFKFTKNKLIHVQDKSHEFYADQVVNLH